MMNATAPEPASLIAALRDPACRQLVAALVLNDVRLGDLALEAALPQAEVAALLEPLCAAGVLIDRPSDANAQDVYYHLDLDALRSVYQAAGAPVPTELDPVEEARVCSDERTKAPRVLFLCTRNSARSQLAEGITRLLSKGQVDVFSAGTQPGVLHPMAIDVLTSLNVDVSRQHSKHLEIFLGQSFDYVITVCDNAGETCPVFPGAKRTIHWSIPDPAGVEDAVERGRAFRQAAMELQNRIRYLLIAIERERSE
ncbi:MAG: arsenate reductase ArsC [Kouleothrix sp.]|nr:arsenate reductase ArsC [Kouleothrix sp.]